MGWMAGSKPPAAEVLGLGRARTRRRITSTTVCAVAVKRSSAPTSSHVGTGRCAEEREGGGEGQRGGGFGSSGIVPTPVAQNAGAVAAGKALSPRARARHHTARPHTTAHDGCARAAWVELDTHGRREARLRVVCVPPLLTCTAASALRTTQRSSSLMPCSAGTSSSAASSRCARSASLPMAPRKSVMVVARDGRALAGLAYNVGERASAEGGEGGREVRA